MDQTTTTEAISLESLKEYCQDVIKAIDTSISADDELAETIDILSSALAGFRKSNQTRVLT